MGNRKRVTAGITGAAALIIAPFIHGAFSSAAANIDDSPTTTPTTSSTSEATNSSTNSDSNSSLEQVGNADKGEQEQDMPVTMSAEITNGQASVTVNGEKTVVEEGETLNKTVADDSSTTHISITNTDGNLSATTNSSSGRTRINSRTSTSTKVNVTTKESETIR